MDMHSDTSLVGPLHDESNRQGVTFANSSPQEPADSEPSPEEITRELKLVLASPPFRPSKRSQEFLFFVVHHRLEGNAEPLKERTIGAEIFHRPIGYDTGYDSVVRVLAGEVRRRLHLYSQTRPADSRVQIDLPVGSYTPEFSWLPLPIDVVAAPISAVQPNGGVKTTVEAISATATIADPIATAPARWRRRVWQISAGAALAIACALLAFFLPNRSVIDRFWSPLIASKRPVLIYVPKLICYRLSDEAYKRTADSPGEFDAEVDRLTLPPNLKPTDTIRWSDMVLDNDQGPGTGDVKAAIRLTRFLLGKQIDNDVRLGNEFSFKDMRTSPTVVIGAFSNRWTLQMTSGLHFAFADENGALFIKENGGGNRKWFAEYDRNHALIADYGIVTRLANSSTGQYTVFVAGISASGSDAAADLVTNPDALAKALASVPGDWSKKNIQIVVRASVTDLIISPPTVVGTFVW
jgi:hypothetical protein